MSTSPQIIVRTFGEEPKVLFAIEMQSNGRHVNVNREPDGPGIIGWPITDAFDFDIDDFTALHVAFSENNKGELDRLYSEMRNRPRRYIAELFQCAPSTQPESLLSGATKRGSGEL